MANNLKEYYDMKYDTGDYRSLYGYLEKHSLPSHYLLCALYIRDILMVDIRSKILEVGCGTGALLYAMKSIGYDGYENMIGIDISDKARDLSIMPDITFQGDAAEMNFKDKSFDLIVSIGVYEHLRIEDLDSSLKEIIRVGRKAVLWIDKDKKNSDHCFNEDEIWWANRIAKVTNTTSICVDKKMAGGSGIHPILVNFNLKRGEYVSKNKIVL